MKPRVMIVAAEASSAIYAEKLILHWKTEGFDVECFGVGTKSMESLGFERLGKSEEMAVVGAAEIISHFGLLKSVFDRLVEEASLRRPHVVIVMDYPEFNLMLSKRLHKMGLKVVYYISPHVWAWRQGRIHTIRKYCTQVLLLFPFEVPFFEKYKVPCRFVGHPILDEISEGSLDPRLTLEARRRCGIQDSDTVLGLMPGSRRLELKQHFSIQLEAAKILLRRHPKLRLLILVAPTFEKEDLHPYLEDFRFPYMVQKDDPAKMIQLCDLLLVASGTATLMVGLLQKPMVIMYRMKWLTGVLAKLIVTGVKYFGMVNLILNREVAKERFQSEANPETLAEDLERILSDSEYRQTLVRELAEIPKHLGHKGATARVAEALREYFRE